MVPPKYSSTTAVQQDSLSLKGVLWCAVQVGLASRWSSKVWGNVNGNPPPPVREQSPCQNDTGGVPCAVRALCEKLAVLHHREFGKFRRLEGCH